MSAKLFHFPEGMRRFPSKPAQDDGSGVTGRPRFVVGDRVRLKLTDGTGMIVALEMGLIQRGTDLVLVWRYAVQFGAVRLGGFLVDELEADATLERA